MTATRQKPPPCVCLQFHTPTRRGWATDIVNRNRPDDDGWSESEEDNDQEDDDEDGDPWQDDDVISLPDDDDAWQLDEEPEPEPGDFYDDEADEPDDWF